jgi:GntR family transcriptional regulator
VFDYERVMTDISGKIERGELQPGQKLPSIVRLAEQYDVSQTTVKTALLVLRQSGLIIGRQGKGTFVAEKHEE